MKNLEFSMINGTMIVIFALVVVLFILAGCTKTGESGSLDPNIIRGEIVVGFGKNVSQANAEELLLKYQLEFIRTDNVNMGKVFFYETGEKFIVKVPTGKEKYWIDKLKREKDIKDAGFHYDPLKVRID